MNKKLEEYINNHLENKEKSISFIDYLYYLMDKYNIKSPSKVYSKAHISRQLWSSIISEKSNPSLIVCIKIALSLNCTNHECKYLLKKAGYTLASSNKYNLIIRYCIENKIYELYDVNELLKEYGYEDQLLK